MQNLYVLENKIIQNFNRDNKKIKKLNFFPPLINIFLQLPRYRSLFVEDIIALFTCYNPLIFFQDSKSLYEKLLYIYHNSKREYISQKTATIFRCKYALNVGHVQARRIMDEDRDPLAQVYPFTHWLRPTVLPRPLLVLSEARRDLPQSLLYPRTITLASAY